MEELPEGFDLSVLLAPITAEAPTGTDLRKEESPNPLYHRLRDARAEAREAERAAETPRSPEDPAPVASGQPIPLPARWRIVRDLASEALSKHSKDLEIAAWLTEALVRSDGLIGFAAGSRLMAGFVENFWDELFPKPDEDGVVTRVAPIAGLNGVGREGTLIQPLRRIVLFNRPDGTPFEFSDYLQSVEVAGLDNAERRQQRLDRGVLSFDAFEKEALAAEAEARKANGSLFASLRSRAAKGEEEWQKLTLGLDTRAGADAPPTSRIRDLLEQIQAVADRFASPEIDVPKEPSSEAVKEAARVAAANVTSSPAVGALASREDGLRA